MGRGSGDFRLGSTVLEPSRGVGERRGLVAPGYADPVQLLEEAAISLSERRALVHVGEAFEF